MRRRGRLGLLLLGLALAAPPAALGTEQQCPGPHCPEYSILCGSAAPCRWPSSADGLVRIHYWVNPSQNWLTEAEAIGAVRAGARAWMAYNPRVRLIYRGTTEDYPVPGDGKFVVGWVPWSPAAGVAVGKVDDFDIWIDWRSPQRWRGCYTRCAAVPREYCNVCVPGVPDWTNSGDGGTSIADVQGTITHEFGHVLGLGHAPAGLTMASGDPYEAPPPGYVSRERSTLGLGDVRGLKALYPWTCPKLEKGQTYPAAYRYICPTIHIFVP